MIPVIAPAAFGSQRERAICEVSRWGLSSGESRGLDGRVKGRMRWLYAGALYKDPAATLDDLCAAATTLEDTERTARRVMGGAHPITMGIELSLRNARAVLHRRETSRSA